MPTPSSVFSVRYRRRRPARRPGSARPAGCVWGMLRRESHRRAVPRRLRQAQRPSSSTGTPAARARWAAARSTPWSSHRCPVARNRPTSRPRPAPLLLRTGRRPGVAAARTRCRSVASTPGRRGHRQHGRDQRGHPFPLPAGTAGAGRHRRRHAPSRCRSCQIVGSLSPVHPALRYRRGHGVVPARWRRRARCRAVKPGQLSLGHGGHGSGWPAPRPGSGRSSRAWPALGTRSS